MANLVVVSDVNKIECDFGVYAATAKILQGAWQRDSITSITIDADEDYIEVHTKDGYNWTVCYAAFSGAMIIDSVNGVAPSSTLDLYDKLIALIV